MISGKSRSATLIVLEMLPNLGLIVGAIGLCGMVGLVLAGIIARVLFNQSIPISIEYSGYLIPVVAFWGAVYTLRLGGHVNADMLICRMPVKPRQWLILAGYILSLGYLIPLSWHTLTLSLDSIRVGEISIYPSATLVGYPQLLMSIGIALLSMQLVIEIIIKAKSLLSHKTLHGGKPEFDYGKEQP